jgi:aspartate/glutamate racemase
MTRLLEQAISRLQSLPEEDQDAIANLILEEIKEEERWDQSFAQTSHILEKLAASAMAEHRAGLTQDLDPEAL